jgi:putative two-component system response regulator
MIQNEDKAVALLAEFISLELGYSPGMASMIRTAASLHDIGKLTIDPAILNKPGKLDRYEQDRMKMHTINGGLLLGSVQGEIGKMARLCCVYHHEWYSGDGYWGLYMNDLPLYVQIVAVCDVLVALVHERQYKSAWPPKEAMDYIQGQAGTQFNPGLVTAFLSLIRNDKRIPAIFGGWIN